MGGHLFAFVQGFISPEAFEFESSIFFLTIVILGGADTVQNPFTYLAFSKTQAFSPRGRCRAFDASADGYVRGEGCGVIALKRLDDAVADGDRILATILGSAVNQDGRTSGLTTPTHDAVA